jgi:patatin-like phospholipase/acyl hydrolase
VGILDGGGTRGLSTLYILREVMGHVISGDGGDVRPCEYFDLMGGAGLSALSALLFVRFVSVGK